MRIEFTDAADTSGLGPVHRYSVWVGVMSVAVALWLTVVNQHSSRWVFAVLGVAIIGVWFAMLVKAEQAFIAQSEERTANFRAQIADTFGLWLSGEMARTLVRTGRVDVPVEECELFEVTYDDGDVHVYKVHRESVPARVSGVAAA